MRSLLLGSTALAALAYMMPDGAGSDGAGADAGTAAGAAGAGTGVVGEQPGAAPAPAAAPEPAKVPEPADPVPAQKPTMGRIVFVTFPDDRRFDGETSAMAFVTKVLDDGSLNVKAIAPNGGADLALTGVKSTADVEAMPDGADKNAALTCTWDWPPRS